MKLCCIKCLRLVREQNKAQAFENVGERVHYFILTNLLVTVSSLLRAMRT